LALMRCGGFRRSSAFGVLRGDEDDTRPPRVSRISEATAGNAVGEAVRAGVAAGPLFLVGVPRSGTTLLYKLLCLHPQDDLVRRRPGQRLCER